MRKTAGFTKYAVAVLLALPLAGEAAAHGPGGQGYGPGMMGPGMMGPGMMGPCMMGPGMMGPGTMGPGMMGPGMMGPGMMGPGMMGPGMMGPGMMGPGMMGPGMMGYGGMGPWMMQPGLQGQAQGLPRDLSASDVKQMMEQRLAWANNPNIKVGKVEEKSEDVVLAEIVTKDGSLVHRWEINRHTGWMQPVQ